MNTFAIITDSSANLPDEYIDKYDINVLSLAFYVDGKEYHSYEQGVHTDLSTFYHMMREGKEITTSCVNPQDAHDLIERLLTAGSDILYLGFSSALSATYSTVSNAMEELSARYPERKLYAVDTLAAALGEGLLVTYAAMLRENGRSIEEVRDWVFDNRNNLCHWFTVEDLQYLRRGGRISGAAAFVGSILKIKPVLHVNDEGKLIPVGKERGMKKALDQLIERMSETYSNGLNKLNDLKETVFISHADSIVNAEYIKSLVKKLFNIDNILIHDLDPVIGAHSGPGTIALFFLGTHK